MEFLSRIKVHLKYCARSQFYRSITIRRVLLSIMLFPVTITSQNMPCTRFQLGLSYWSGQSLKKKKTPWSTPIHNQVNAALAWVIVYFIYIFNTLTIWCYQSAQIFELNSTRVRVTSRDAPCDAPCVCGRISECLWRYSCVITVMPSINFQMCVDLKN